MKYWKTAAVMLLMGASVTLAGCGTTPTMMEEYSFGQVQLKAGNSEVYMDSPFDLAHVKRQDNDSMMYINKDDHVVIAVTSQALTSGNAQAMAEQDVATQKQTLQATDLQTKLSPTTVNGKPAVEGEYSFTVAVHGNEVPIVSRNLFFEDTDQVWHIMYQYRQSDEMGKEVTDYVFGHIH